MKTCFPALPIRHSIFCVGTCSSLLFLLLFLPYSLLRLLFLSSALESDSMSSTPNLEPIRQALGPYVKLRDLCTVYLEPRLRLYKLARTLCGAKGPDPVPSLEKTR